MNTEQQIALLAIVPPTIAALAAWRSSKNNRKVLETGNGKSIAEYVVHASKRIDQLHDKIDEHNQQDEERFAEIHSRINDLHNKLKKPKDKPVKAVTSDRT